ncbi:MAG: type III PLP-dependent enzyme domain-containing protein [Planctomycetota bacterium]|jgi:diaminopimelate decarboxylase
MNARVAPGRGPAATAPHAPLFALEDAEAGRLAEQHGTPLFAYRASTAAACWSALRAAVPARVRIAYAVKANPHPELLRLLARVGASFDCASGGELVAADEALSAAGVEDRGARLLSTGPGKRDEELACAVALGARVQAEGWEDLARLDALGSAEAPLACTLRVHPAGGVEEAQRIIGGGGPSAFGVDEEDVPALLARAAALTRVRITGLHVFAASNERDAARLLETHAMVLALARGLHTGHGLPMHSVDFGGGLGVPYAADQAPLDLAAFGAGLGALLAQHAWFEGEPILEPGRFLAAPCGVYLARVVRIKQSRGSRFAILEGGLNHLMRPALTGQAFPVRRVEPEGRPAAGRPVPEQPTVLTGPLCTGLDRLGTLPLPADIARGDLLAFGMTGAYGATEAMPRFLSHPVPPEIWLD